MKSAISTHNLRKSFKSNFRVRTIEALKGVSLEVHRGEAYGYIGHNGAGKTTLIKCLMGLIHPTSGEAEIMGKPIGHPHTLDDVGFLPERPYFYEYLSGREALDFYGRLNSMNSSELSGRIDELLELLGLQEAADRRLKSYSKGMLQRLGMAQAILHNPHLVILDEPMSGLDPLGRGLIKRIIHSLKAEGKTVFFSTHIMSDLEELCDRIALISHGTLLYQGKVESLLEENEYGTDFVFGELSEDQLAWLHKLPGELHVSENNRSLFLSKEEDRDAVLRLVIENGIALQRMIPRRASLEEVVVNKIITEQEEAR